MMRLYRLLFIFILFPICLKAQDTLTVKRQAGIIAKATSVGDYKTVIDYTYPGLIALSGGREQMRKLITDRMADLKTQGIISITGTVGSPGRFYNAGTELHCLLPEDIIIRTSVGRYRAVSYLLGVSTSQGKSWTFVDVGAMPIEVLHKLFPNFNDDLKIPPPVKPEFLPD